MCNNLYLKNSVYNYKNEINFLTDNKSIIIKNYLKNEYRKNNLIFDIGVFNENDNIFNLFFNFF